ncbi:hypothetical protein CCL08_12065 [Pseudomonas congelans]|nr:hypothetical protein CCL08_12065 [Pseudomonas congelans]
MRFANVAENGTENGDWVVLFGDQGMAALKQNIYLNTIQRAPAAIGAQVQGMLILRRPIINVRMGESEFLRENN